MSGTVCLPVRRTGEKPDTCSRLILSLHIDMVHDVHIHLARVQQLMHQNDSAGHNTNSSRESCCIGLYLLAVYS